VVLRALSCVARMERHTKKRGFGVDLIAKVATGSKEKKVLQFGFDKLSTWGVLAPADGPIWTVGEVADLLSALVDAGALTSDYTTRTIDERQFTYREVALTPRGWDVLKRTADGFRVVFPHAEKVHRKKVAKKSAASQGVPGDLVATLKDLRRQLADQRNVPAYVVAPNKTLEEMARLRPTTKKGMLAVHGMGETRWQLYGKPFLDAIRTWQA
jgi:ATP-dependent DNA helicase RecQ